MSASILWLPFDVVDCIAGYLSVRDYTSLSLVSHKFWEDLKNDGTARKCIQNDLPFSTQAKDAIESIDGPGSRKCLDTIFSRKEALRTASPYSATLLGHATSFIFDGGVVCYSTASHHVNEVRFLDLRHAARTEKVIDSRYLAQKVANPGDSVLADLQYLTITGFRHSIVTIVCDFGPLKGSFLFAINIGDSHSSRRTLLCERLRSTNKIIVRHDRDYLYYGTHSATGLDDYREWLIQGFDLSSGKTLHQLPIQLCNFAGSDLHSVVDFVIHNGTFYAITNQTSFESEEINWTSYYCYVSFPVDAKEPDMKLRTVWRRQDAEGPINDSWTHLMFEKDETSGELLVLEVRKEWLSGGSSQLRTCYMQPWVTAMHGDWDQRATANPADRLSLAVEKTDKPRFEPNVPRWIDRYRHYEFGTGYTGERYEYLNSKTKWKSYSYANNAFVDLVVDDVEVANSWRPKERVRLRVVSRKAKSPLENLVGRLSLRKQHYYDGEPIPGSEEKLTPSEAFKWPRPGVQLPDELEEMMCPGGKAGDLKAELGDEGIVYMGGVADENGQRALVYLSFDPGFGFEGMKRLDESLARPRRREGGQKCPTTALKRTSASSSSSASIQDGEQSAKRMKLTSVGLDNEENAERARMNPSPLLAGTNQDATQTPGLFPSVLLGGQERSTPVQAVRERLLCKSKAKYLALQQGWWLR